MKKQVKKTFVLLAAIIAIFFIASCKKNNNKKNTNNIYTYVDIINPFFFIVHPYFHISIIQSYLLFCKYNYLLN